MTTSRRSSTTPEFGEYRPPANASDQARDATSGPCAGSAPVGVLAGVCIVSLAMNLPGPVALMRLAEMGATCEKIEPPAPGAASGDPLSTYAPEAFDALQQRCPTLAIVNIVGERGAGAERPGHDLTYEAQARLVHGLQLPVTPFADMAGALLVTEAVLRVLLKRLRDPAVAILEDVSLAEAGRSRDAPVDYLVSLGRNRSTRTWRNW